MRIVSEIPVEKYPNKAILVPSLNSFLQHKALHSNKFQGADFKCDDSFFEFWCKNT